jgi:hypothetical protein
MKSYFAFGKRLFCFRAIVFLMVYFLDGFSPDKIIGAL